MDVRSDDVTSGTLLARWHGGARNPRMRKLARFAMIVSLLDELIDVKAILRNLLLSGAAAAAALLAPWALGAGGHTPKTGVLLVQLAGR